MPRLAFNSVRIKIFRSVEWCEASSGQTTEWYPCLLEKPFSLVRRSHQSGSKNLHWLLKYLRWTVCTFHETIVVSQTTLLELASPLPPPPSANTVTMATSPWVFILSPITSKQLSLFYLLILAFCTLFTEHSHPRLYWRQDHCAHQWPAYWPWSTSFPD